MKDSVLRDLKFRNREIDEIKPDSLLFENDKVEIYSREVMNSFPGCYFKIRKHTIDEASFYPFIYFDLQTAKDSEQYFSYKDIIESTFNRYTKNLQSFEDIELSHLVSQINDQLSDSISSKTCIDYLIGLLFPENGILLYITSRHLYRDNFTKATSIEPVSCGYPSLGDCINTWNDKQLIINPLPTQIKHLNKNDFIFFENESFTLGSFREDKNVSRDSVYYLNYMNYMTSIFNGIKNKSKVTIKRENVPRQYEKLEFDFSQSKTTAVETCNILLAVEKILRLYPAIQKGYSKSILINKKTDHDLKKYFTQYKKYFKSGFEYPENDKFLVFNHIYEQEPLGSSFLLGIKQKVDGQAFENKNFSNLIDRIKMNREEEIQNYLKKIEEFSDVEKLEELEVIAEESISEVIYLEEVTPVLQGEVVEISLLNDLVVEEKIEDLEELHEPDESLHLKELKIIEDFGELEELDSHDL